ncbi:protein FAR-RED IMPAIRED RESPONSE 1-like [Hibiscus syriacus]|uniref:Copper transport protein n=2 Tax=Hibiscus syriacus TaxID=106335 RepID=A0A6A2ZQA9_HIBSY|nr:protein FAR-RED IMPAIRED RESPONSE 1-like [Hibiscus syriacus]
MASTSQSTNGTFGMHHHRMMMMHMTFFWGNIAEILFSLCLGRHGVGMYTLALIFMFMLAFLIEWLSHCQRIKPGTSNNILAGVVQTLLHAIRVGLAYLVMLSILSFNGGAFLMAVACHTLGFLLFGSRIFKKNTETLFDVNTSDPPPMSC